MLFRKFLVVFFFGWCLNTSQAATYVSEPANVEDVKTILQLMHMDQVTIKNLRNEVETTNRREPERAIDFDIFFADFTPEAVNTKLASVYANFISHSYAKKLLTELQTPIGKLTVRLMYTHYQFGKSVAENEFNKLSIADKRAVNAFKSSTTFSSFLNAQNNAGDEQRTMMKSWIRETAAYKSSNARRLIADAVLAEVNAEKNNYENNNPAIPNKIPRTGMRSFDLENILTVDNLRKQIQLNQNYFSQLQSLNATGILKPENLISREKIEASNILILAIENLYMKNLEESTQLREIYLKNLQSIPMSAENRQTLIANTTKQMATIFEADIKSTEQIRLTLEIKKRIIQLCEKNFDKIELKDNKLYFSSDEALNTFNSLIAEHNQAVIELKKLDQEDWERRERYAAKLRK